MNTASALSLRQSHDEVRSFGVVSGGTTAWVEAYLLLTAFGGVVYHIAKSVSSTAVVAVYFAC